ncbi:MAG: hypothetical protein ACYCZV_14410 [Acidimicrobiales bacterium]
MSTARALGNSHQPEPDVPGCALIAADTPALPEALTSGHPGPRFGDDVWDLRPFVPRTTRHARIDFTTLADPIAVITAKEYLYSRLRRAVPTGRLSAPSTKPLKLTGLVGEFNQLRFVLAALAAAGVPRLAQVTQEHLDAVLRGYRDRPHWSAQLVRMIRHLAGHGPFLSADRLTILPWAGRAEATVTGRSRSQENSTERIPEHIAGPLIRAAMFYVETASADILAARAEIAALQSARAGRLRGHGQGRMAVEAFITARRQAGRAIPALPLDKVHKCPDVTVSVAGGVVQAPGLEMVALLAGTGDLAHLRHLLVQAGGELGYEQGGLDTVISSWPDSGVPWRSRLGMTDLRRETAQLRTACWIAIAYLSGMRDGEVRELGRDCAFTEPADNGRTRYKLRGRVYKDRCLAGEEAEWVVLEIVHQAVAVLRQINDDPTHLFGYTWGAKHRLMTEVPVRLASFVEHCNRLFSSSDASFVPNETRQLGPQGHPPEPARDDSQDVEPMPAGAGSVAWAFNTRQFRRTLAWHIAHQPFGVVAGARQYKHAAIAMFEGYAGTSASGFAAEVASEAATAQLDYAEELYRDWNDGGRSGGGATAAIDAEFDRIRREMGDLPGTVPSSIRLRTMLQHLTKTLYPGVLNDCFYRRDTAVCAKGARANGRPLPMLNMCSACPNARRSSIHLPRLTHARDQAHQALQKAEAHPLTPLQRAALTGHTEQLDRLITQITDHGGNHPT